jgi:2,3-bisphosphoglycerate-independent phosphoglycerate mutase
MKPHVTFLFIDGIGLGPGGMHNPFSLFRWPTLERLAQGHAWTASAPHLAETSHVFHPIDATLGVDGLPQSGTGQTALFTGVNAPALAGKHWGPFPHSATHRLFPQDTLFARLRDAGRSAQFLNAYPDRFFSYVERTGRWSTTTRMVMHAGGTLCRDGDVREGRALTAEITGQVWRDALGLDVPLRTPHEAGHVLHANSRRHDLVLFEYFVTDKAGHSQDPERARASLADLDALLAGYLDAMDPARDLLVLTSDHGNLEDLSVRTHTFHPVPLLAYGLGADYFAGATSLLDVTPTLVRLLT